MPNRSFTPLWLVEKRHALARAIGDEGLETQIWLQAAKASGGTEDPEKFHVELESAIRARCGDRAEQALARFTNQEPSPSSRWQRSFWLGSVAALLLIFVLSTRSSEDPGPSVGMYFVLVDRYADETPDRPETVDRSDGQAWHGGDLAGILSKLDEIEALGVDTIWLSPISETQDAPHGPWGAYHGYWVEDLDAVDPRFGSLDTLRALSDDLHARGMRLYLDIVLNHVGPAAPLVREHPDWFHHYGDIEDWSNLESIVTGDVHGLPDLAQENEAVYTALRDACRAWIEAIEPDGFRIDAVRHLPPGFLARLGADLETTHTRPRFLGEIFDGDPLHLAQRAQQDRLDEVFDFPLAFAIRDVFCEDAPLGRVAGLLAADYGAWPITLVDNHDLPRIRSACRADDNRVGQALAFLLTARGTPSITYGTEIGLEGSQAPENRADMRFGVEHPYRELIRDGLQRRRQWEALREGSTRVISLSRRELSVARLSEQETVLIHINQSSQTIEPPRWTALRRAPDASVDIVGYRSLPSQNAGLAPMATRIERWDEPIEPHLPAKIILSLALEHPPLIDPSDRIVLVGAGEALGTWDPRRGVPLGTDELFLLNVEDGEILSFKLAIVHSDNSVDWEPHSDRFLLVTSDRLTSEGCGNACAPAEAGRAHALVVWADLSLIEAIDQGNGPRVAQLLASGADPMVIASDGETATQHAFARGHAQIAEDLLNAGAPLSHEWLNLAVRNPNQRLFAILLSRGAPFDVPDTFGMTPIMHAASASNRNVILRLKQLGADLERRDLQGRTAMDHANDPAIRELLIPSSH